jgi:aminoglycoside 3-N-acetyltransferase
MTEGNTIERMERPNTRTSLREDFIKLGLESGMVVIIHSSLSSLGWVCGGPVAVIQALMDVVGEEGTIVMPTQSAGNSDPSE